MWLMGRKSGRGRRTADLWAKERDDAVATIEGVRSYLRDNCGPFVAADGNRSYRGASREVLLELIGSQVR